MRKRSLESMPRVFRAEAAARKNGGTRRLATRAIRRVRRIWSLFRLFLRRRRDSSRAKTNRALLRVCGRGVTWPPPNCPQRASRTSSPVQPPPPQAPVQRPGKAVRAPIRSREDARAQHYLFKTEETKNVRLSVVRPIVSSYFSIGTGDQELICCGGGEDL